MSETNIHGLSRTIPKAIKRQIRQECGFGCVTCGLGIATYEHIDPPFADAREHDPSKIAFLCGSCHDRVTRGVWSKEKVKADRSDPWCIRNHHCHDAFDVSEPNPVIWAGPNEILNMNRILSVDDDVILSLQPPDQRGGPYSISGEFYDDDGNLLFRIDRNEWIGRIENWDIETVGRTIVIRTGPGKIALRITALPPKGIIIERAYIFYRHARFIVNEYQARLVTSNGGGVTLRGRRIVGYQPDTVFLRAYETGKWKLGGGQGKFAIEGPPTNPPDFVKNRPKIGHNSQCPCESGRKFKECCALVCDGERLPGRGPMLTFEGIPLD